jgi:LAS superfamily LD-carboxypeptidase LdcB
MDAVTASRDPPLGPLELTGRARSHVVELADPRCVLHREVVGPWLALRAAAARAGIDLLPGSSFRDFGQQLRIWNAKFRGERALLDAAGEPLDAAALDEPGLVEAILHWSALPGASRHHWGTEIDVIDAAALPAGQRPALVPAEYAAGGVFARLGAWLDACAGEFGFYRPYDSYRGGVQPEPWHLSYAVAPTGPLLTPELLAGRWREPTWPAREAVLARLGDIRTLRAGGGAPPGGRAGRGPPDQSATSSS